MYFRICQSPTAMHRACFTITFFLLVFWSSFPSAFSTTVNPKDPNPTPTSVVKPAPTNADSAASDQTVQIWELNHNSSEGNNSVVLKADTVFHRLGLDTGAVKRTFYVVATLTGVVLLYFTFKGIRTMRRRRRKPRRYGLLADSKEMKQFRDEDEDDSDLGEEDATLFDARKHKPSNKRGP